MKDLDAIVEVEFNFTEMIEKTISEITNAIKAKNDEIENLKNLKQSELTELNLLLLKANKYDIEKLKMIKDKLIEAYQLSTKYNYWKGV